MSRPKWNLYRARIASDSDLILYRSETDQKMIRNQKQVHELHFNGHPSSVKQLWRSSFHLQFLEISKNLNGIAATQAAMVDIANALANNSSDALLRI